MSHTVYFLLLVQICIEMEDPPGGRSIVDDLFGITRDIEDGYDPVVYM